MHNVLRLLFLEWDKGCILELWWG